ncbi:FadR family transcriptional regulator [Paenibacillus alkaliterrae]|uniref:FadR/GntR family transcriptional regulator n=1 Tax=Paenibacillus alkaliterrae TaxID=320909 RepID=UPI001F40497E|nr:FadR/GntR family transcriptional regulator [Paenibacillus alkaliterrae]MCF2937988.1 FadR family transcriptional regulator [Paenibacillus alkaliterrae]
MIQKLEKKSLVDQVYLQIEKMIQSGKWKIGERIPSETELIEKFGISRNTLREAIRAMVHVGMLETKQGDGTFVTASSELNAILQKRIQQSNVLEILDVRHALDRESVLLACKNRTDEDLINMRELQRLTQEAFKEQDLEKFVLFDFKLHQTISTASHNQLLSDIYSNLFEKIQSSIANTTVFDNSTAAGHVDLIEAIEMRDIEKAVKAVDAYIESFKKGLSIG